MKLIDIGHRVVAGGLMLSTAGGFAALYSGYLSWSAHMRALKAALAEAGAAAAAPPSSSSSSSSSSAPAMAGAPEKLT